MWEDTMDANRSAIDTQCRNCGSHVSPQFARVFGDNEDCVYNCLECTTVVELTNGAATQP